MKSFILVLVSIFAVGCATPGELTDDDFLPKRTLLIDSDVPSAVSTFYHGMRHCGRESNGIIFAVHYGRTECSPPGRDGHVICDIYVDTGSGSRYLVLGRLDFIPVAFGNNVELRVRRNVGQSKKIISAWERMALGEAENLCPRQKR